MRLLTGAVCKIHITATYNLQKGALWLNILIPPHILYGTIENSSPNIEVFQSITQRWTKKQFSCTKGVWVLLIVVHRQTRCTDTTVKPYGSYYTIPALPSFHSPHLFPAVCVDYTAGSSTHCWYSTRPRWAATADHYHRLSFAGHPNRIHRSRRLQMAWATSHTSS